MIKRLQLRRSDGKVHLDRWGIQAPRGGALFLHRMTAPDSGVDLHSHPWDFYSLILSGGYDEERVPCSDAVRFARRAADHPNIHLRRGFLKFRLPWTVRKMTTDEAHRITRLYKKTSWSIVLHGPKKMDWGFFTPSRYVDHREYYKNRQDGMVESLKR